jgi:hypothetical protein
MNGTLAIGDPAQLHVVVVPAHDSLHVSYPEPLVSSTIPCVLLSQQNQQHQNHVKRQHVLQLSGVSEHGPIVPSLAVVVLVPVLSTVSIKHELCSLLQHAALLRNQEQSNLVQLEPVHCIGLQDYGVNAVANVKVVP